MDPQQPIAPMQSNPAPTPPPVPPMKAPSSRKGMKIALVILIVIVLAIVGYFIFTNLHSEKKSVFHDADNFYSLEYPTTWKALQSVEGKDVDVFQSPDNNTVVQVIKVPIQLVPLVTQGTTKGPSEKISGYTVDTYTESIPSSDKKGTVWAFNVPIGTETVALLFVVTSPTDDGRALIKSVKINKDNGQAVLQIINKAVTQAQDNGKDAKIKASLSAVRAEAELFFENKSQSYLGVCKNSDVLKYLNDSGSSGVACKDAKTAYAVSAKLFNADYFCADSTGQAKATKSAVTTTVCPQ
jgi:hypothetical protein